MKRIAVLIALMISGSATSSVAVVRSGANRMSTRAVDVAEPTTTILHSATAGQLAVRGTSVQESETLPPPTTVPTIAFAPEMLDGCDEMQWYRADAGLPARFDAIGYRESRCRNDVTSNTGCCVGYWQLHEIIFRDSRVRALLDVHCGSITWRDVKGNTPSARKAQACAAAQLYKVQGMSAWSL